MRSRGQRLHHQLGPKSEAVETWRQAPGTVTMKMRALWSLYPSSSVDGCLSPQTIHSVCLVSNQTTTMTQESSCSIVDLKIPKHFKGTRPEIFFCQITTLRDGSSTAQHCELHYVVSSLCVYLKGYFFPLLWYLTVK